MTQVVATESEPRATAAPPRRPFPPVAEVVTLSLTLIIVGGVLMASGFPGGVPLAIPVALLAVSAALLLTGLTLAARWRPLPRDVFRRVFGWALLAQAISAAMIEYAFVRNHAGGSTLLVVSLMLVLFAVDVPVIIGFTVARYQPIEG